MLLFYCMLTIKNMSTQIFKSEVPKESFFSFLDKVCTKTDKFYVFNNCAYKKGNLLDVITPFLEECKPHYHLSKLKYIEKTVSSIKLRLRVAEGEAYGSY